MRRHLHWLELPNREWEGHVTASARQGWRSSEIGEKENWVNQAVLLIFEHHKAIIVIIREFNRAEICCRILQFIEFTCAFFVSLYSALKNELEEHKKKSASEDELNSRTRVCARCRGSLGFLFNSGAYCPKCSALVCKLCRRDNNATQWLCTLCAKIR